MKIDKDLKVALEQLGQIETPNKTGKAKTEAFGAIFGKELDQAQGLTLSEDMGLTVKGALPEAISQQTAEAQKIGSAFTAKMEDTASQMDGLFSMMENYAQQLGTIESANLREAYATLQSMDDGLAKLKEGFPNMASENPELAAMLNELDVITSTEIFKFNRGDYL